MRFQRGADAGLISRAALLKPAKHRGIQPQGDQLFGVVGFRPPATDQLTALIEVGALKHFVG
jgi:hypothetical protein